MQEDAVQLKGSVAKLTIASATHKTDTLNDNRSSYVGIGYEGQVKRVEIISEQDELIGTTQQANQESSKNRVSLGAETDDYREVVQSHGIRDGRGKPPRI